MAEEEKGKKFRQYLAAISVCMGSFSAGAGVAWIANIALDLKEGKLHGIKMSDNDLGLFGSLFALGALPTCLITGPLCDLLGRKLAIMASITPSIIGLSLILFPKSIICIKVGRFIMGLTLGSFSVAAPLYIGEIAETDVRGTLGSFFALTLCCGILYSYTTGYLFSPLVHTVYGYLPPILFIILFSFQPETPSYCIKKGKKEKARENLVKLRGVDYDVDRELNAIKNAVAIEIMTKEPLKESLRESTTRRSIFIIYGQMLFQQMSGVNVIIFYTTTIFESGGTKINPQIVSIIVGVVQVVSTAIACVLVERLGRKILLMISGGFMGVSTLALGIFFSVLHKLSEQTLKVIGVIPIIFLCLFFVMFCIGYGPIPWMMSAEIFPPENKSILISTAAFVSWGLCCFITGVYFPLRNAIGIAATFFIFTGFSFVGVLFIYKCVFETKGKSLKEIQEELGGNFDDNDEKKPIYGTFDGENNS